MKWHQELWLWIEDRGRMFLSDAHEHTSIWIVVHSIVFIFFVSIVVMGLLGKMDKEDEDAKN